MQLQDTLAYRMATLDQFVGREFGVSEWLTFDQARIVTSSRCASQT